VYGVGVSNQLFSRDIPFARKPFPRSSFNICTTKIVPLWEHCSVYPPSSCSSTIIQSLHVPKYPHPFTFPVCIERLLTFAFVIIVSIETFHAILTSGTTWIVEFGCTFCSEGILFGYCCGIGEFIVVIRPWKRPCWCGRWHRRLR